MNCSRESFTNLLVNVTNGCKLVSVLEMDVSASDFNFRSIYYVIKLQQANKKR